MTPQERQLLESLASRVASTAVPQKDPEAEVLIREKIGSRPDALYILTQTVLIQEMALNQADSRIHDLQQQSAQPLQQPTSFLGRLFGSGAAQQPPPQYAPPPPQYASQPQYGPPPYYQQAPSQGSSFLRSAATTATGVAAGALAFEGIEALLGHHGGFGGGGYGGGEFLGGAPSETVINNYYDEPRGGGGGGEREQFANTDFDPGLQDGNDADISAADYDSSSDSSGDDFSSTDV